MGLFFYPAKNGLCNGAVQSAFASRFLTETTHSGSPRIHCNAVILLAPSKDGLDIAMQRVADVIAWEKVKRELSQQSSESIDPSRMSTVGTLMNTAAGKLNEAVRQAWCMAVTLDAEKTPHAYKLNLGSASPFPAIKGDSRLRVQSTAINAESLLPNGPYNLWGQDDQFRSVKDILGTFTKLPNMPKMLSLAPILDTLKSGCADGVFVLRLPRPDGSARTWWMCEPDTVSMEDSALELWLPEFAKLESVEQSLVLPESGLGIWNDGVEEITVGAVVEFFSGGKAFTKNIGGYDEEMPVPAASKDAVHAAVVKAVKEGSLWLLNTTSSVLAEEIPTGVLTDEAKLRQPPEPIGGFKLAPESLPEAWSDNASTVRTIADILSQKAGVPLPWITVKNAVQAALAARCIEIDQSGGAWPCDYDGASKVKLRLPGDTPTPPTPPVQTVQSGVVSFSVAPNQLYDLGDVSEELFSLQAEKGISLKLNVSVEIGEGAEHADEAVKEKLRQIFAGFREPK